jgi:hypothetical protein
VTELLDAGPAVVLIDGLDEVGAETQRRLESEIQDLADHSSGASFVVSCRSGALPHIEGFSLVELIPLDDKAIHTVAQKWLGSDAGRFLAELKNSPIADLASRPLFLAHLLTVFRNGGSYIPDQPSALYRRIVRLMLQDWDEEQRVVRHSRYAAFHVEEKMEFLSALAFELLIESKAVTFSTQLLEESYREIAPRFGLPANEAGQVASELETHTGVIVESGRGYEFSHLSLQEYLVAYHLVRQPFSAAIERYFNEYPAPVAVAVALSSDPSRFLVGIVEYAGYGLWGSPGRNRELTASVNQFVSRLVDERPRFAERSDLGYALIKLMSRFEGRDATPFVQLVMNPELRRSFVAALTHYMIEPGPFDDVRLVWHSAALRPKSAMATVELCGGVLTATRARCLEN